MFRRSLLRSFLNCRQIFQANMTSWTPLAQSFNSKPNSKFVFCSKNVGLFGVSALKSPEGFHELQVSCQYKANCLIDEAVNTKRSRNMVKIFDELSDTLCQVADLADFIRIAHPVSAFSQAAEEACCTISGIVEKLNTNFKLYQALKDSLVNGDIEPLTEMDLYVTQLFLFDFEQCGIILPKTERNKVVELNDRILSIGQQFVAGSARPRNIKKKSLPENVQNLFEANGDNVYVTGLYTDSPNPVAREVAYLTFLQPDENQERLLIELLQARHELARLCGFNTYAERALRGSTVDTPKSVMYFLDNLTEGIWSKAQDDFDCMAKLKKIENPNSGPLSQWDVAYFTQKAKKDWFCVTSAEYSPYFSLGACMEGLNMLFQSLYGIQLVNSKVSSGECWNDDVYKLSVMHETEGLLGFIFCDFYERTGKPNQDCHFTIRGGRELSDGSYQNPIVVLMLNLPTPRWSSPSLLTPNMVDNLFHEMGHAMHSMLARTKYQHISGTRCSTDFAEVPSVLMEYFSSDVRVLKRFAKHFQTKQPMSDDMLRRLCASKHLFTASETQVQIFYAALDQMYHSEHPLPGSTTEVLAAIQKKYYCLPYVPTTTFQLRFSHLVGYGAKYYSYLISRALAQLVWQTYFEKDPFNRIAGEKYRKECLGVGGGKNPKQLVADLLQCDPTPDVLAKSLVREIDRHQRQVDLVVDLHH